MPNYVRRPRCSCSLYYSYFVLRNLHALSAEYCTRAHTATEGETKYCNMTYTVAHEDVSARNLPPRPACLLIKYSNRETSIHSVRGYRMINYVYPSARHSVFNPGARVNNVDCTGTIKVYAFHNTSNSKLL